MNVKGPPLSLLSGLFAIVLVLAGPASSQVGVTAQSIDPVPDLLHDLRQLAALKPVGPALIPGGRSVQGVAADGVTEMLVSHPGIITRRSVPAEARE